MSTHEHTSKKAKFSDMHFQVGQRVQIILEGPIEHKQYTSVIGWVENEFLMLRVPQEAAIARVDHKWGEAPFHYVDGTYIAMLEQLKRILA